METKGVTMNIVLSLGMTGFVSFKENYSQVHIYNFNIFMYVH